MKNPSTTIELQSNTKAAVIYYSENDSEFKVYDAPFHISEAVTLKVYSELNGKKSPTITTQFFKIDPNLSLTLETEYANQYNGGGKDALIDGIVGAQDFRTGTWQGYFDKDVIATVDLGSKKDVNTVTVGFLQDQRSWIFYPTAVECWGSNDGKNFKPLDKPQNIDATTASEDVTIKNVIFKQTKAEYRYIKVVAKKLGELPEWHLGYKRRT